MGAVLAVAAHVVLIVFCVAVICSVLFFFAALAFAAWRDRESEQAERAAAAIRARDEAICWEIWTLPTRERDAS